MKIIGKSATGYLLEATEDELAQAMGFRSAYDNGWQTVKRKHSRNASGDLPSGTVLPVKELHDALLGLRYREGTAEDGAKALEAIAILLRKGLPSAIFPPELEAPATPEGTNP